MRVFLTGATGFLGARVLPLLEAHEVLCGTRRPEALPQLAHAKPLAADFNVPGPWVEELRAFRPQWWVHLAWDGLPDYSLGRCRANLDIGLRLLDLLTGAGCELTGITMAGTCWEYGEAQGAVGETAVPQRCGVFAATKHALRDVVESVARTAGIEHRWARLFFLYGTGQRAASLIPSAHAALSAGRVPQIREPGTTNDFIHVDDAAAAIVALTERPVASGIYNVGTGTPTSVADVVNRIAERYGRPPLYERRRPARGFWADTTKTLATGWRPRVPIDAGIARTLDELDRRA